MRMVKAILVVWVSGAVILSCSNMNSDLKSEKPSEKDAREIVYTIPSDPHGRYKFLGIAVKGTNLIVMTERIGKGNVVSYSTREINCNAGTFRYLAEGDTLEQMKTNFSTEMSPLTEGSISSYVAGHACNIMHDKGGYKYKTES